MHCKISNCSCGIFTTDGYCEKHKYYTRYDMQYIRDHILVFYIKNINEENSIKCKSKKTFSLFRYMSYKKEFFIENPKFHIIAINKGKQFLKDIEKSLSINEYKKYVSFINEIESFNI